MAHLLTRILLATLLSAVCAPLFDAASAVETSTAQVGLTRLESEARRLFRERRLTGGIVMHDVRTGALIVSASEDLESPVLPLSVAKLFLAASYWEHRSELPGTLAMDPHGLLAVGWDRPGRELATALRHSLGSAVLLDDLSRFGFPQCTKDRPADCTSLSARSDDKEWASAMSIGEAHFKVTLPGVSRFLVAVGGEGDAGSSHASVLRPETARQLRAAMLDAVATGSASGIRDALGSSGRIGGKTGSGPENRRPLDGIFAGLVFDPAGNARYTVVTYVHHGGMGGGAAAQISADLAKYVLRSGTR